MKIHSSWLNNMAEENSMIWVTSNERYLSIAKRFLGFYCLFALVVMIGVIFLPKSVPNITRTCLPNRDDSLECGHIAEVVESFLSDVLKNKYEQMKEKTEKYRDKFFANTLTPWISSNSAINTKMKPAAKLIGKELPKDMTQGMIPIDTWCSGVELDLKGGFLRHGVRYYKGRLVVPVPGTYFVYSFVEFYEPCFYSDGTPKAENRKDPIKHALFKYSVICGENVEIIGSAQQHKIAKNKYENVYGSHISTVVDLKAGDELSVQVNNVSLLSKYAGDNYFGLVLIE